MPAWSFEHSVTVHAHREAAWRFWSDVANWAKVDPAVEWASLDGPFATGTRGQTKPVGAAPTQWMLVEVEPARRAVIELAAPGAILRFVWMLSDEGHEGTRLTQRAELDGDDAAQYLNAMRELEANIPLGMDKLVSAIEASTEAPLTNEGVFYDTV